MVLDGTGWHPSHSLQLPAKLLLLGLPPYSPELDPDEHFWHEIREKARHSRAFHSINAL